MCHAGVRQRQLLSCTTRWPHRWMLLAARCSALSGLHVQGGRCVHLTCPAAESWLVLLSCCKVSGLLHRRHGGVHRDNTGKIVALLPMISIAV